MMMAVSNTRLYTLFMINEECLLLDLNMTNSWCRTDQIRINASICKVMRIFSLLLVTFIILSH